MTDRTQKNEDIGNEEGSGIPSTIGGTEVLLLKENATLRTRISMLELALDEIYCSVRRAKPAPECPTDCKAVLHDELYNRNIELLHIAVRNHNAECSALEKVHKLNEELDDANVELTRLRNIIAESNIKPVVTGQGIPPRPAPKKG